jgi:hypothetical protein
MPSRSGLIAALQLNVKVLNDDENRPVHPVRIPAIPAMRIRQPSR